MRLLIFISLFSTLSALGQDVHFSMYRANPLTINPALAGNSRSNVRAAMAFKDQWASLGSGYRTYSASVDGKLPLGNEGNFLTGGLQMYKDVAGTNQLGTFKTNFVLGSIIALDRNQELSLAIMGGVQRNTISTENMEWDTQYGNGTYNSNWSTGETMLFTPTTSSDFGAGLAYTYFKDASTLSSNDMMDVTLGVSAFHLNRPQTLWSESADDRTSIRFTGFGEAVIGVYNTNFSITPGFYASFQGPHREYFAGAYWGFMVKEASKVTGFIEAIRVSVGTHFRMGDAFIPSLITEVGRLKVGVSYDANFSGLRTATVGKGGFEVSIIVTNPSTFYYKRGGGVGRAMMGK